jgi:hypothetical protein
MPITMPPRRKRHPQASPWLATDATELLTKWRGGQICRTEPPPKEAADCRWRSAKSTPPPPQPPKTHQERDRDGLIHAIKVVAAPPPPEEDRLSQPSIGPCRRARPVGEAHKSPSGPTRAHLGLHAPGRRRRTRSLAPPPRLVCHSSPALHPAHT